jgi:A/G-specific adenine glycosylase
MVRQAYQGMLPDFTKNLLRWNRTENHRSMPWKGEQDPYRIWLSEIILQQTRVKQGLAYYERFILAFPSLRDLANAPETEVFKLWEGLGYYNRCRNLLETAKIILGKYKGNFPKSYDQVLALKGIGRYTAAAIVSFAYNLPYAVVDGNVERVLARYFGVTTPGGDPRGRNFYEGLASALLDSKKPGIYNQALMDFGATVCKPRQPLCQQCIQRPDCMAYRHHWTGLLPLRQKPAVRKKRWLYYFLAEVPGKGFYLRRREKQDIWKNLFEPVLWETDHQLSRKEFISSSFAREFFGSSTYRVMGFSRIHTQQLTHQTVTGRFIYVRLKRKIADPAGYGIFSRKEIDQLAFPKLIREQFTHPDWDAEF